MRASDGTLAVRDRHGILCDMQVGPSKKAGQIETGVLCKCCDS